jgi:outer membrane protein
MSFKKGSKRKMEKGNRGMMPMRRPEKIRNWLIFFFFLFFIAPAWAAEELPAKGKPFTLEQCVALALKYHPSLMGGRESVLASKARVEQALAAYYPQINLNGIYNTATNNYSSTRITQSQSRGSYDWTFYEAYTMGPTLHMTLYDFGRTSNSVQINRENVKASEETLSTTRQSVVFNVKQAYFGALQYLHLITVAEETINQMKYHLEQARGFYQAGTRPKIDVTKAEVDLANAQLALIQVRNNYQVARVTLNNAMGLRQTLTFPIEDILGFQAMTITQEEILRSAYERRPELLQLKAQQRSQEATVKLAQSNYYPILSGDASYLYRGPDVNDLYWDASLTATVSIPIFTGFSTRSQIAEAKANLRNLNAQEETLKLNIRLEAEQAFLSLQLSKEQIDVTEKSLGQAKENYDLATGRYQVGVGSPLEVADAEASLANARANNIQALYNYKVAEAKIIQVMGVPVENQIGKQDSR